MYVRLAFATAIHVEPDVLIVDEALAVGDAIFANRCLQKLEELKNRKVTILFVSHDLGLVKRLCHRAILMLKGEVFCEGSPSEVVNRYVALVHDKQAMHAEKSELTGNYVMAIARALSRRFESSTPQVMRRMRFKQGRTSRSRSLHGSISRRPGR